MAPGRLGYEQKGRYRGLRQPAPGRSHGGLRRHRGGHQNGGGVRGAVAAQLVRDLVRRNRDAPGRLGLRGTGHPSTESLTRHLPYQGDDPLFPTWGRVSGGWGRIERSCIAPPRFAIVRTGRFTSAPLQRSTESSRAKVLLCSARHRVRLEWLALLQGNTRAHSHRTPLPRRPRGSGLRT